MESLSDTKWDVVISGTGLQQSLLALALSRSGKNILHVDPSEYYGATEAALSLQELDEWADKHHHAIDDDANGAFAAARVDKFPESQDAAPPFSRAYNIALAPQLIHTRSELLSQLVSSKAFHQIEFLAVGSFYIYQPAAALNRIPSTREDVFSNAAIPAKSKRSLMKFLKFVFEYDSEPQTEVWRPHASEPLHEFLAEEFKLDKDLQAYIITLTLSLDGKISVETGLTAIHRHLTSMGVFGAGFAAVYPKWGGLSEVTQVGCRASAVGGAVYMLGVGIKDVQKSSTNENAELRISLSNDIVIESKRLFQTSSKATDDSPRLSRLTAVVDSKLLHLFETVVEGAPTPSVAVVVFPAGSALDEIGSSSEFPIYAMVHSSDTGECPSGQCVLYLSTSSHPTSQDLLNKALTSLLTAIEPERQPPANPLYKLSYEQIGAPGTKPSLSVQDNIATLGLPPLDLAFNDSVLRPVKEAWELVMSDVQAESRGEYMTFTDREGANVDDDVDYAN